MERPDTNAAVLDHYRQFWGGDRVDDVHWTPEHLGLTLSDFHIAKVRPAAPTDVWTFATIGAWRATPDEHHCLEFVAVARSQSAAVMQRLGQVAYYHAARPENRLNVGHTLDIGEPWMPGSKLDALLISLPYPWGPTLEHLVLPDRHIRVLWLLPIASNERAYAREHGYGALEQLFQDTGIDYSDPYRSSVVGSR